MTPPVPVSHTNERNNDELKSHFVIEKKKIGNADSPPLLQEKIIYVTIDDEVADIIGTIKKLPHTAISLVVPHRALLFKSSVNLHILLKKMKEYKKVITIVSRDESGLTASQNAGFLTKRDLSELKRKGISPAREQHFMRGEKPARLINEKKSIAQVIHSGEKRAAFETIFAKMKEKIQKKRTALRGTRIVFITPNKQALFTLILVSILLFLSIAYIALPGATIAITPRESVLETTFNVTFLDHIKHKTQFENDRSPNLIVPSYEVDPPPFSKNHTHIPTGKISRGERARGVLTIYNTTDRSWDLAATTRFQTDNGLIFRTPRALRIGPASRQGAGSIDVEVIADDFDIHNQVIGSRGNIAPTKFFLPGLQEESRKKLYAESKIAFTGGATNIIKMVTEEDIKAAIELLRKKITVDASNDLKNYLEQQNLIKKTNVSLITDKNVLKIAEPTITIPQNLVGQQRDQFEISATYTLTSIAYDKAVLIKFLRDRLLHRADPDKKILRIADDDLSYRFLESEPNAGRVKLTVTMRAIQTFDLDPETENGKRFIKKITDHILGLRIDAAKDYLRQQTDEIAQVSIKTWPVWAPTIPNIADNIKFVVNQ